MKKINPDPPQLPDQKDADTADLSKLSETTERTVSARLRNPNRPDPVSHVFSINPNIDTESLLCHATETLASLNVMTTDLACELEGSRRNEALAIQQLVVLAELMVNRALDILDPPCGLSMAPSSSQQ
ncbi:hypothetical protein BK660_23745 [Pseudomonas brassicacearum]|uniref:DUF3077 domain-containing protein n=1 Tax=Pseudomonas brassicacearum TaxID=930166 RepID=A0A423HWW3_9PSED|nr:DUF6124 family protein [Pseudomonas brassicacearum]RON17667.1 hypothetical protein BK660_23745 [Pseudomonas brassicacearum]